MIRDSIFTYTQKLTDSQLNLPNQNKKSDEESIKQKTEILRRRGPVIKSVESVLKPE